MIGGLGVLVIALVVIVALILGVVWIVAELRDRHD
jgi:hypothetical protein